MITAILKEEYLVHHGIYLSSGEPYWCLGFKIGHVISYISDTNYIPPDTMERIVSGQPNQVFVVDCLRGKGADYKY